MHGPRFERYVALGDSSTEGLDDPDGQGGYRGWANRLAERIAAAQGSLLYANLGVRGLRTRQIRDRQLEPARAMRPDLATLFTGTNDAVSRGFNPATVVEDLAFMQRTLIAGGATVVSFTLPELSNVLPFGRWLSPRVHGLNDAIRRACAAPVRSWWTSRRTRWPRMRDSGVRIAFTPMPSGTPSFRMRSPTRSACRERTTRGSGPSATMRSSGRERARRDGWSGT